MKSAGGGEVDVDGESFTIKTEAGTMIVNTGNKEWPSEIPEEIPKFDYGSVDHLTIRDMDDGKWWTLIVEKIPVDVLTKYQKKLRQKGFSCNLVSHNNEEGMLIAENGKIIVAVMAGEGNASVSVFIEKN